MCSYNNIITDGIQTQWNSRLFGIFRTVYGRWKSVARADTLSPLMERTKFEKPDEYRNDKNGGQHKSTQLDVETETEKMSTQQAAHTKNENMPQWK